MHEKHVIDDLIRQILFRAEQEKAAGVSRISVWLGALSHMTPSHFRDHFKMAAHGTIAGKAKIAIEASNDLSHPHADRIILKNIDLY